MPLSPRRLFFGTSTALVLLAFLVATLVASKSPSTNAERRVELATARIDSTLASSADSVRGIALGYLERARLGLGSPFRLVDMAARDPRLGDTLRRDVAWAIVGRVMRHDAYVVDPATLDAIGPAGAGDRHLGLIERVIDDADDPRTAEAALRIAYSLAAANGTVGINGAHTVAEVAAQLRDRRWAIEDLAEAMPAADRDGVDLIDELQRRRANRLFAVERPLGMSLSASEREAAIEAAPAILREIEALTAPEGRQPTTHTLLDARAARALRHAAISLPPLGAVRVPVTTRLALLREDSTIARATDWLADVTNEESLVAAASYADQVSDGRSAATSRLLVAAGVALRAHAQDKIWFPGDRTPSVGSVVGLYGLRSITFDSRVPAVWRPFYVTMIASALDDFRRVLPGYDPTNLAIHVTLSPLPDSALAMHDPRNRTLRLSAWTPTGTLAHELAHDVDWLAGRRLFSRAGGYATDRSLEENRLALATSMRGLTSARVTGRARVGGAASARPAEVFARSVDWLVADALGRAGIMNGYLTAIQDPIIAGYASIPGDAASVDAADALVKSLTEMTYLPDSIGGGYVERWHDLERLDPGVTVTRLLEAPVAIRRGMRPWLGFDARLMSDLATASLCRVDRLAEGSAQDRLLAMVIDARARGIVVRRAHYTPAVGRPAWARAVLGEPLSNPDAADDVLRRTKAAVAEAAGKADLLPLPPAPFRPVCD